jgi:hypothetical protein
LSQVAGSHSLREILPRRSSRSRGIFGIPVRFETHPAGRLLRLRFSGPGQQARCIRGIEKTKASGLLSGLFQQAPDELVSLHPDRGRQYPLFGRESRAWLQNTARSRLGNRESSVEAENSQSFGQTAEHPGHIKFWDKVRVHFYIVTQLFWSNLGSNLSLREVKRRSNPPG